jgi:uncharacterized Zn finger protein
MSGEFGSTTWGRDWLRLAEPTRITRPSPALPRARSLARNDRVQHLDLTPGYIAATIDDRRQQHIHITLPTWNKTQLATARTILADARGEELPDQLHTTLVQAGLPLAPDPDTLHAACSCSSRTHPSPHLLAVYVELALHLDEQPRNALLLRGLTDTPTSAATSRIPLDLIDPATFYTSTP